MTDSSTTAIVARNSVYQIIGKIVAIGLSMVAFTLIVKSLSQDQFGYYTLVSTIFALVIGIADLRIEQVAIREATQNPSKLSDYISQVTVLKLAFGVVVSLAALVIIFFTPYPPLVKYLAALSLCGVLISAIHAGYVVAIQCQLKPYIFTIAEVVSKVCIAAMVALIAIPAFSQSESTEFTLLLYVVLQLIIAPILIYIMYIAITKSFISFHFGSIRDRGHVAMWWQATWPLWILGVLTLVHYRADMLLLSLFKPISDLAIYGLPYRYLDAILLIPPLFIASIYPIFSRYASQDVNRVAKMLYKSLVVVSLLVALLVVVTIYAAPQIVHLFGGENFYDSILVLRILSLALIGSFLSAVLMYYMIAFRYQRLVVVLLLIVVSINVLLCLLLIPSYSYNGAAVATATSELLTLTALLVVAKKYKNIQIPVVPIAKIFVASMTTFVILWLSKLNTVSSEDFIFNLILIAAIGALASLVYGAICLLLRVVDKEILFESMTMMPILSRFKAK